MAQEHLAVASFSMLRRVPKTRIATAFTVARIMAGCFRFLTLAQSDPQ